PLILKDQARAAPAVAAEVDDDRIELRQAPHELVEGDGRARLEAQCVAVGRHLELALNFRTLLAESERVGAIGIRREEEDHMLFHAGWRCHGNGSPDRSWGRTVAVDRVSPLAVARRMCCIIAFLGDGSCPMT